MDKFNLNSNDTKTDNNETYVQYKITEIKENEVTIKEIILNLLPNIGSSAMGVFIILMEVHFIGMTKDNELYDGIGLAQMYMNVIVYNMGCGFSETINILCSKSFGSSNFRLLGIQTNQIRLIVTIFYLFIVLFNFFFCEIFLNFLVGPESYVHIATTYIFYTFPGYYMCIQYDIFCKHSESQLVYKPILLSMIFTMIAHPILCYTLIVNYNLKVFGAIIATNASESIKFLTMLIYFYVVDPYPQSNFFYSKDIFKGLWETTKLSSYSAVLFFAEYIGFSVANFFAAPLGEISYAKHINVSNISNIPYIFNYGFLNTVSILVGNYVGENNPVKIRKFIKLMIIITLITEAFIMIFINVFQNSLVYFFSENDYVYSGPMGTLVFIMSLYGFMDMIQSVLQGILRGLGTIHHMVYFSISIFIILQPILNSLFIYLFKWGLDGLWIGIVLTISFLVGVYLAYLWFNVNIEKVCLDYKELSRQDALKEKIIERKINEGELFPVLNVF